MYFTYFIQRVKRYKRFILRLIHHVSDMYCLVSNSQEGEDIILHRIFYGQENGFYIDIGSHHPRKFSNTNFFYKLGWHGINIDANPESKPIFDKFRKRDININAAISSSNKTLNYYMYKQSALNTMSNSRAESLNMRWSSKIELESFPLSEVLSKIQSIPPIINFMSIDVEGLEIEVLKSNDWDAITPLVIVIEALELIDIKQVFDRDIYKFLTSKGYSFFAKTVNSLFFVHESALSSMFLPGSLSIITV